MGKLRNGIVIWIMGRKSVLSHQFRNHSVRHVHGARLSSDGKLYTCLFASEGFDLRELIRSGLSDEELLDAITGVWERRADRYSDERTEQTAKNRKKIGMSYIGG